MTGDSLTLLLVQADHVSAQTLQLGLEQLAGRRHSLVQVARLAAATAVLGQHEFDAILYDQRVDESQTVRHELRRLKDLAVAPVVVLSDDSDQRFARELIRSAAADDSISREARASEISRTIDFSIERHALKRELREARRETGAAADRFHGLIQSLADGVVILADDGSVLHCNRRAAQMLERQGDAIVGQRFEALLNDGEVSLLRSDGSLLAIEVRLFETEWRGRRARMATLHDLGPLRKRERDLQIARHEAEQANAMKSRFLANMSHELRTPLNSILGFSEMITSGVFGPIGHHKYADYAGNIHESATHLLGLITDLLDVSRAQSGHFGMTEDTFSIAEAIDGARTSVAETARERGLALEVDLSAVADLLLLGDVRRIRQVFVNLLSNAIKFTREGGSVRLTSRLLKSGDLEFTVADDGIGMAPDQVEEAFEAYVQTSDSDVRREQQGSGLGLAMSRMLVELHDGSIELTSWPGRGTEVAVRFPAARVSRPFKARVIQLASRIGSLA